MDYLFKRLYSDLFYNGIDSCFLSKYQHNTFFINIGEVGYAYRLSPEGIDLWKLK